MTWLSQPFSVVLTITLLLAFMTADFTVAHSPKYNKKDVLRIRRSVSPSKENVTTTGSTTSFPGSSNKASATTQVPETTTKNSSHNQSHQSTSNPYSGTAIITHSTQPKTYQATVGPRSSGSDKNTPTSTIKQPFISTTKVSSGVTSQLNTTTLDISQSSRVEPHAPTTQPTPLVTSSSSQVFPATTSVHPNAPQTSSAPGNTTLLVNTTVAGVSGDSKKRMTTDHMPATTNTTSTSAIGLHPRPHPKVTSAAVTTTTSKSTPPSTPKKSDCPLQTAVPGQKQQGLVSNCLIAIASLAGLATFFMVCSIILCTKLSGAKHRYRLRSCGGEGTEMVCISSLLPDGEGVVVRPKIPKSNGALIPITDVDGDSDCGDNLTLNSFLPDGDRL